MIAAAHIVRSDKFSSETRLGRPQVRDERLSQFLDAWLAMRGEHRMPRRRDVDPQLITPLLPYVWIYRWLADEGTFRCELAGESIHDAWRGPIMGRTIDTMFSQSDFEAMRQRWLAILQGPAVMYGRQGSGSHKLAERLICPISDDTRRAAAVFGISIYSIETPGDLKLEIGPSVDYSFHPVDSLSDKN
jgi:hypothetical protein